MYSLNMGKKLVMHAAGNVEIFCEIRGVLPSVLFKRKKGFSSDLTQIPLSFGTRRNIEARPTAGDAVATYFRSSGECENWQTFQQFWSFNPGKRKRLTKERQQKKEREKVLRWEEDSSFYTHRFLSMGDVWWAEAAAEARPSSPCKWINSAFIFPNLHVKNPSVFERFLGVAENPYGGKTRQVVGKLFQTVYASSSSLTLRIQWGGFFLIFPLSVLTQPPC